MARRTNSEASGEADRLIARYGGDPDRARSSKRPVVKSQLLRLEHELRLGENARATPEARLLVSFLEEDDGE